MSEPRQNFKLHPNELFITTPLLNNILIQTTANKAIIEETSSELWYETLNGPGTLELKNKIKITGNIHYGIISNEDPDNPCEIIFPSGTKYIGTVINNEITGKGEYIFSNGSSYKGEVLNGLRHGKGIFKTNDNIIYEGDWKFGLKHGNGRLTQGNMELEGTWDKGVISGICRIKWKSGNIFEGQITENKMNGNGYMIWNDKNEKYTGQWENNLQNGLGIYIWFDNKITINKYFKDRYVGEWKDGKRDGYGIFFYSNGSIYEGYWKEDKKEGFGILNFQDRTKISGLYHNDILISDLKDPNALFNNKNNYKVKKLDNEKQLTIKGAKGRRRSFNSTNNLRSPTRLFEKKQTKIINLRHKELKKEEIKEKKENEDNKDNKNNQGSNDNSDKNVKTNNDDIKIKITIDDLSIIEHIEKDEYKKIDDLLLRNLSLITKLYIYSTWRDEIKSSELGFSTGSPSFISDTKSRSMFQQQLQIKKEQNNIKDNNNNNNILFEENIPIQNEEQKEINLKDNIYSNDLYFCLDFNNFWKFLRESGIVSPKLSLAMIDRLIFQNPENEINLFLLPEELEKLNKTDEKNHEIYNYIYQMIIHSKKIFEIKNLSQIDLSKKIISQLNKLRYPQSEYLESKEEEDKELSKNYFNYHDPKNIILFRYFYEILIRIAFLKFEEYNVSLELKLTKLLELIKAFLKSRRKAKVDSSFNSSIIDHKLKNIEGALELYIYSHHEILKNIFIDLYTNNCTDEKPYKSYDMTLTYRFFFDNIILNSEKLSEIFYDKMIYIDLISVHFKKKKITSNNLNSIEENEVFEYFESLYDYEMIFREFCELVFYISRKYFLFYDIDTKVEDIKSGLVYKEEKKTDEEEKRSKKKKKTKTIKKTDIYMLIIDEINKAKNIWIEKKEKKKFNKYFYPVLKSHKIIERNEEEKRLKIIEEQKKIEDKLRYELERKTLKEEDINIYKGDDEQKSNSDSEFSEYD